MNPTNNSPSNIFGISALYSSYLKKFRRSRRKFSLGIHGLRLSLITVS